MHKNIAILLLTAWILFSAGYIVNDLWQDFKTKRTSAAYEQGKTEIIQGLIQEAAKCQPFNIFNKEQKVDLIAVQCLQQNREGTDNPANEKTE